MQTNGVDTMEIEAAKECHKTGKPCLVRYGTGGEYIREFPDQTPEPTLKLPEPINCMGETRLQKAYRLTPIWLCYFVIVCRLLWMAALAGFKW